MKREGKDWRRERRAVILTREQLFLLSHLCGRQKELRMPEATRRHFRRLRWKLLDEVDAR